MSTLSRLLSGGTIEQASMREAERTTLIVTDDPVKQYSSFILCTALSAIIATGGIAAESTAIVIGAMLIAPLMSPMIGTSFAITTGRPKKALKTVAIAGIGTIMVIAIAALVSLIIPAGVSIDGNSEISSRIEPRVVDLIIAIASGFVGALAIARDDIADAIPGVAIAVSIVPPLCVVGIGIAAARPSIALGALLLFVVNFFAIQLAGNLAFFLMGFGRRPIAETQIKVRRFWYATAIIGTLILAIPLVATSNNVIQADAARQKVREAVDDWLAGTGYERVSTKIDDDTISVEIAGDGQHPPIDDLLDRIEQQGIEDPKISVLVAKEYRVE